MPLLIRILKSSFVLALISIFCRVTQIVGRIVLVVIYRSKMGRLTPIEDPILLMSATKLATKIRNKQLKSEELVKTYINRIREVQPIINAVVDERFLTALEEARRVDEYLLTTDKSENALANDKPFLGVPFTSKQIIAVKGLALDGGLVRRKGQKAQMDADVVALMRQAGGIPLAVTNLPEISMGFECNNIIYGRTLNPYDLTKTPGGSSGGECALQTSGGSVLGIGNDLAGSLRIPALFCGIYAHKPSRGIVSNSGQYPAIEQLNLQSYLSTGPLCRYAEDLLPALRVMSGDKATVLQLDKNVDLTEVIVYYTEDQDILLFGSPIQSEVKSAVKKVVDHLKKSYGVQAKSISFPELKFAFFMWGIKTVKEQTKSLDQLLTGGKGLGINGFIEFFKTVFGTSDHTIQVLHYLFQSRVTSTVSKEITDMVNRTLLKFEKRFQDCLGDKGIFICPTYPELYSYHNEQLLKTQNFGLTAAFNLLGLPVTQCPVGLSQKGYPLGVQVVSNVYQDHLALAVACEIEKAFGGWKQPSNMSITQMV